MRTIYYYADDLNPHTEHLDLPGAVQFGHSTWGRDVGHHLVRHGDSLPHGMSTTRAEAVNVGLRS